MATAKSEFAKKLKVAETKNAPRGTPGAKPYKVFDKNGLHLLVGANGSRTWKWNYRVEGIKKDSTFGSVQKVLMLGEYPALDVVEAQALRKAVADKLKTGVDPAKEAEQEKAKLQKELATTFGGIAQEWIAANAPDEDDPNDKQPGKWSRYYHQQVRNFMGRYVCGIYDKKTKTWIVPVPPIGLRPISEIKSPDIAALVKSVGVRDKAVGDERKAKGAPSIAVLVRQWCGKVFSLAIATGRYENNNPALGFDLKTVGVVKPAPIPNKALGETELRELLAAVDQYSVCKPGQKYAGQRDTVIAIQLLLLTAVRTGELRKAQWPEFNLITATWTIPGARMKMGLPHVVPLSKQAIALLEELRVINPPPKAGLQWLFPNRRRGSVDCMGATTINRALQNMGFNGDRLFRAHGARGTASTTLNGQDYDSLIVDSALAHKQKGVAGIYNQGKYLKQRRAMMQVYADHLDSLRAGENS
jgi:integrase